MASGTKEYKIVINGIKESVSQIDALNKELDILEKRLNDLQGKGISVGSVKVDSSALKEQDNIQRQILATEEKISDVRDKEYQNVIKLKDELKQAKVEAEGLAASSKLMENNYSNNTMAGLKEQLKDIKRVLNTTEIDSPMFKQLTEEANTITQKLKDMEAAYGTFGRNVGNYASAAEGFKGLKIQVGDVTREFDSAKEALKQLKNERDTLALMGEDFHDIDIAVKQLQSSLKDLNASSSFMDNMLDSMQSIVAIASTAKGIGAVFGMDNDKIEETIKKLVALQNVLQGLETIQKQMQTQEGIGKWLSAGNNAIDKFSTGLFGAKKAVEGVAAAEKTATVASKAFGVALKGIGIGLIITLIVSLTKNWDKINAAINKSIPSLEKFGGILGWLEGLFNSLINVMGSAIEVLYKLIQGDFSGAWGAITEAWNSGFQEVVDDRVREEKAAAAESLKIEMDLLEAKYGEEVKYTQRYRQLLAERNKLLKESYNPNTKEGKKALRELEVEQEREKKAYKDHAKEMAKLQREADRELTDLKIANMKEGLNKTITQLEEERKRRIAKAKETGRNVREIEAEINRQFDNEILKSRKEYAEKTVEIYREMIDAIAALEMKGMTNRLSMLETNNSLDWELAEELRHRTYTPPTAVTYGSTVGAISKEDIENAAEYTRLIEKLTYEYEYLNAIDKNKEPWSWETLTESIKETEKALIEFINTTDGYSFKNPIIHLPIDESQINTPPSYEMFKTEQYEKEIDEVYKVRMGALKKAYDEMLKETDKSEREIYDLQIKILKASMKQEASELTKNYEKISGDTNTWYERELEMLKVSLENKEITIDEYNAKVEEKTIEFNTEMGRLNGEYHSQMAEMEKRQESEIDRLDDEFHARRKQKYEKYYQEALQETRDYETAIRNIINRGQSAVGSGSLKAVFDYRKKLKEARQDLNVYIAGVSEQLGELNSQYRSGLISPEVFQSTNRELQQSLENARETLGEIQDELKQGVPQVMSTLQPYVQAFGQTLSSVLNAVWAAQDAAYEKEMEQIDKDIEAMEKKLDEQKALVQKYSNDVNSIEDELSTARGDRRQELIDQLNTQKAAEREALAEQKRIEREKEKLDEKAEKMELEQRRREQRRDVAQAVINSAMAVSYALVNRWPMPAIALAAAAAVQGAAQVAAIKAQKFASGGLLNGRSHSQGGIPVGNTGIEVEGNEYIIRKKSVKDNVSLLDFINRSERKLNIDDFIDFYSSTKKSVNKISPQRRYATGGQLNLLPNNIDMPQRILDSIDAYANRPVVVSVVDIIDRADDLRGVQVAAGIEPKSI